MKKLTVIALSALCLICCSRQPRLVILHLNDTHSHFEPERGTKTHRGGVIERAAVIDSVRQAEGESRVLLVHAGDFSQGSSYFSELKGDLEIRTLNALRYDCVTLGNHEFDNGLDELARRLSFLESPVVGANIVLDSLAIQPYVKPWVIVEKGGVKIGVIGLVATLDKNVAAKVAAKVRMLDNAESVNRCCAELKGKCDYVIVLSHIGFEEDCALVPQLRGVDLVIGGHSHTFIERPEYVRDASGKKIPVVQDGLWGYEIGKVELY